MLIDTKRKGCISYKDIDESNIPVDISIRETKEAFTNWKAKTKHPGKFCLMADNYQPRRCYIAQGVFEIYSDDKQELIDLVKEAILPLYQFALDKVVEISEGEATYLHYWGTL